MPYLNLTLYNPCCGKSDGQKSLFPKYRERIAEEVHRGLGIGASNPRDSSSQLLRSRLATLGDLYLLYVNDTDLVFLQETTQYEMRSAVSSPSLFDTEKGLMGPSNDIARCYGNQRLGV